MTPVPKGAPARKGGKAEAMPLVLFEKDREVLKVSLNRPSALNAINSAVLRELEQGLREYQEAATTALILFGQGGCFSAGADIKELASLDEQGVRAFHALRERTFLLLEDFPLPTMAVIEKYALGTGLALALCCDIRLASADAKLGIPSARLGLVESHEYLARLVRAVGPSWTKKLIFTAEPIDAKTAWEIGLVEETSSPERIFDCVDSIVAKIGDNSLPSMRRSKRVLAECIEDLNLVSVDDTALPLVESIKSQDFKARTSSFIEKRKRG